MKKFKELFHHWRAGGEVEAEIHIPVATLLLIGGIVLLFIISLIKWL